MLFDHHIVSPTFQENTEAKDPFFSRNTSIIDIVEEFEDPVHENVISDVESAVEELTKQLSAHLIQFYALCLLKE